MTGHRDVHLPTERTNSTAILHNYTSASWSIFTEI